MELGQNFAWFSTFVCVSGVCSSVYLAYKILYARLCIWRIKQCSILSLIQAVSTTSKLHCTSVLTRSNKRNQCYVLLQELIISSGEVQLQSELCPQIFVLYSPLKAHFVVLWRSKIVPKRTQNQILALSILADLQIQEWHLRHKDFFSAQLLVTTRLEIAA